MKKKQRKVLPFPKPPEEPAPSTIFCRIGTERFAIHWEIEDLPPPAAPLVLRKPGAKKATDKLVK